MKRTHIQQFMLLVALSACLLFCGCKSDSSATEDSPSKNSSRTESSSKTNTTKDSETDTKSITITVVNMSGVDVGMFSVIDPVTGEQANLSSLANKESISIEANWPNSVNKFQWALYNMDGELCIEGSTDIHTAKTSATLVFTGDGAVEDVKESFE